ncbi:MAG: phosphate/phosphite/phosphonate ABC transporter substrate-binding protein [Acidobacteria bacterium]|nr:phosphate/phosphite/phosphonate ABC transporter substrate-binding protein [Acidobacteriota bacterium]
MRQYFHEEARIPVEIVLFQSYEAQVEALLAAPTDLTPRIDIAWNTNLAYLQSTEWSHQRCQPIAMRDTDLGWQTLVLAPTGGTVRTLRDLKGRTLALGSRDSGHAAILPVYFLEREGFVAGRDYRMLRLDTDLGKHGDTGTSEVDVLRAVLEGRADAGAVGSPFWTSVQAQHLVPEGAVTPIWKSPPYSHCMFTARIGLEPEIIDTFAQALYRMDFNNAAHRTVLEAEGLRKWIPAETDGYASLREACEQQGFFDRERARARPVAS